jgi:predicted DNA-binding transcriptional regulator AlpA
VRGPHRQSEALVMTGDRLLTAAELGDLLGLSASTVLDRFERGDLPGYRLFGRKGGPVRFRLCEIEDALASWRVERAVPERRPGHRPQAVS